MICDYPLIQFRNETLKLLRILKSGILANKTSTGRVSPDFFFCKINIDLRAFSFLNNVLGKFKMLASQSL